MALPALLITIDAGPDATSEELTRWSRQLRAELLGLDLVVVDFATVARPPGSKALTGADVSSLVVHLSDSTVLVALVGVLREWVRRASSRKVTVRTSDDEKSIEIDGASRQDVADALKVWASEYEHR